MALFKPLPPEILERLRTLGFVHISGLTHYRFNGSGAEKTHVEIYQTHFGKWQMNNSKIVIVTSDGQIWLATYTNPSLSDGNTKISAA